MLRQLSKGDFVAGIDAREQALYTPADAACYLGINAQTLSTWLWGRKYPTLQGQKFFEPVIQVADQKNQLLSFFNLAELHVLAATRYDHHISMKRIRTAMDTVQEKFPSNHPLLSKEFKTNGVDLFVQELEETANLSTPWQLNFKIIMDRFLAHVIPDDKNFVKKIYPLIKGQPDDHVISITYGVSSSQPIVDGAGVPVWILHSRYKAGEDEEAIAQDFNLPSFKVRRAIDYFEQRAS